MSVAHRLKIISDFIDFHTKRVVEQDKAIVLARARAEGIPEYIGNMTLEEAQFRNPVLSRHASASTIHSMHNRSYSMDTTYSHVGKSPSVIDNASKRKRHGDDAAHSQDLNVGVEFSNHDEVPAKLSFFGQDYLTSC